MSRTRFVGPAIAVLLGLAPAAVRAQATSSDPGIAAMHAQWKNITNFITMAADQMPEADYTFRPVATVRTFGQVAAHVAGAQASICHVAMGEPATPEDAIEKGPITKAAITKALKESSAVCERAYAMNAASAAKSVTLFGSKSTGYGALALNAVHNGEHYGNIVTYFRAKGLVPPSSQ